MLIALPRMEDVITVQNVPLSRGFDIAANVLMASMALAS